MSLIFLVADNEECDRWIVRDTDNCMSIWTLQAVLDWIWSGRSFHRMRDHVLHDGPVLAGLLESQRLLGRWGQDGRPTSRVRFEAGK